MRHLPAFALTAAVLCGSFSSIASADSKAWAAAKDNLPDTTFAVSVDMQAASKSAIWSALTPMLLANDKFKTGFDLIKSECKIDAMSVVTSVVIAGSTDKDKGALYAAVPSLGQKKAIACLQSVATSLAKGSDKLTVSTDGNITALSDSKETIYVGFVGDVAVIALKEMTDKAALKAWMGGGGAFGKGALGKLLAKASSSAVVFGGSTEAKQLNDATQGAKDFVGWATLASGTIGLEVHADYSDAASAKKIVDQANQQLGAMKASPPLPALASLLKSLTLTLSGTEATLKASAPEKDLLEVMKLVLH